MTRTGLDDVLLRARAQLAEKIHAPRDIAFQPSMDGLPTNYVLALYPYTLDLAVTYLHDGLQPADPLLSSMTLDMRQKRLDALVRTSQLPWRLLGEFYHYELPTMQRVAVTDTFTFLPSDQADELRLAGADAQVIMQVLGYLAIEPEKLTLRGGIIPDPTVLRDALNAFVNAFCRL